MFTSIDKHVKADRHVTFAVPRPRNASPRHSFYAQRQFSLCFCFRKAEHTLVTIFGATQVVNLVEEEEKVLQAVVIVKA